MEFELFIKPSLAFAALFSGFIFGFLLRKATVSRFDTIVSQLLLKDFTVMKVILTAIVVGGIGIFSLKAVGVIPSLKLSSTPLLFSILGGFIFGIGMSVAGYCPGTALCAIAEGSRDMIIGVVGMLFGSFFFNLISPSLSSYLVQNNFASQKTAGELFAISDWAFIAILCLGWLGFVWAMKRFDRLKQG